MGVTILLSGLCAQGLCRDKDFRGCNNFMKKSNKRLNIGFFTCHLDNDYAYEVCKGVDYAAKELDVNLIVFPGMYMNASYNDPKNARFDYQYRFDWFNRKLPVRKRYDCIFEEFQYSNPHD